MSQASKVLKEIAAAQEYVDLVQAIEKQDYEAVAANYQKLNAAIEEKKKGILDKIDTLPRQNKDTDRKQFLSAFDRLLDTNLPQFERINNLIKEQKVAEGEVFSTGAKGDPMVRSSEGKTVIVSGSTATQGARIIYRVTREGDKVDFARSVELNKDFFYSLLNQNILGKVIGSFDAVEALIKQSSEITTEVLNELLGELHKIREMANSLRPEERTGIGSRIMAYRKKLLVDYGVKQALAYVNTREEKEISDFFSGDGQKIAAAMAAPGLFRIQTFQALKNELFSGGKLKGYGHMLSKMESNLETMDAAMKLMEFKAGIEDVEQASRSYIEKMDQLDDRLNKKARNTIYMIAEDKVYTSDEIRAEIENAFSDAALYAEFNRIFRSPNEFFSLREAVTKLMTMMGNNTAVASEAVIKPYLTKKVNEAFQRQPASKT
jgi:hypothetical protein